MRGSTATSSNTRADLNTHSETAYADSQYSKKKMKVKFNWKPWARWRHAFAFLLTREWIKCAVERRRNYACKEGENPPKTCQTYSWILTQNKTENFYFHLITIFWRFKVFQSFWIHTLDSLGRCDYITLNALLETSPPSREWAGISY